MKNKQRDKSASKMSNKTESQRHGDRKNYKGLEPRSEITVIETGYDCDVVEPECESPMMDIGYGCDVMDPIDDCCEAERERRIGAACQRMCCIAHTIWGIIYMAAGSVQLVAGIFFLISLPVFKVGSNIWTGLINIAIGMITLLLSGYCSLTHCRSIKLLYMTIFLLLVNVINLVLLEVGEWSILMSVKSKYDITNPKLAGLSYYARNVTSIVTLIVVLTALLDSLLTFCSLQYLCGCCETKCCEKHEEMNDCVSDIEYIMPREKPRTVCSSKTHIVSACAPSWVFDGDPGPALHATPSIRHYPSAPVHSGPMIYPLHYDREHHYSTPVVQDNAGVVTVRVDGTSELVSDGDRKINHMKSFSRTPSPAEASQSSSSSSIPPICECLERRAQPTAYRSKLNTYRISKEGSRAGSARSRVQSGDKEHYACLMVELEKSFVNKKETKTTLYSMPACTSTKNHSTCVASGCNESCTNTIDSRQRGSDAEFSKELEAALKLIQDLESPNTIDTPSETCKAVVESCRGNRRQSHDDKNDSDSTKTLSGSSSLDAHGKNNKTLPVESQSTSGYNSPSLDRSSRFTPTGGVSSSDLTASQEKSLSCVIRHLGDTAVISLFSPTKEPHPYSSTIQVSGESESSNEEDKSSHAKRTNSLVDLKTKTLDGDEGISKAKIRRWRQFIERRRRPSLLPEVESAIMKSESLAFLTKSELKDRLNQTKNIHRQIEAKVHRQRSLRKADSFGSVEDIIDRYGVSTYL